ncbi:hypothetical protein BJ878DRAFT_164014 [Calycina marina]|uniref:t-SNARE coiled-coil homology domain-containing protein n=1 Tax=Calycina marina TaxID=1763456 RepID=A0A9P7YZH3_9HELO|nr:hypothetical protein BJ878DRAFT_164014 [Calycina marina]
MADLTPLIHELFKKHDAPIRSSLSVQRIDSFIKEATTINSQIKNLSAYLKSIREAYLDKSTRPLRRLKDNTRKHLSDRDREEIDATSKQSLRELNAGVSQLAAAEKMRDEAGNAIMLKKYRRLHIGGMIGNWAAGEKGSFKSFEQEQEEQKSGTMRTHRGQVILYLRERLAECAQLQAAMMQKRLDRAIQKQRLEALKHRAVPMLDFAGVNESQSPKKRAKFVEETERVEHEYQNEPSAEQLQMFEQDNQEMLKLYESNLDQVKTVQNSMAEISELQNQLLQNLDQQHEQVEQLIADSEHTTENVDGGNRQLKKASERSSVAKYLFYTSCGLSAFLVAWDLIV